ncbi:MAG: biosynthetic-type acetolactate synthase large subunit [Paludisphaera borealis]|uniref:biosynthetic-type acetolactate synthase large subunit n=1 Tax=Paludisphaera borealis TaxID=1387353 RepID=UPI002841521C|nr:biosynthetic-type acetolactate synthase large subunit [Paludisphaera borealis]MDR3621297.1 biosynthetic-type acetolactate synthase large subunit [Paludisphaera borealis]
MSAIENCKVQTAARPTTGADVLVESLARHGVDVVFAYPGGASMPMHQALTRYRDRIRTILPRHEQGGIFAAEGFARASGRPGVVMATSGPGALNLVTGLADAKMDSIPLIAITGQVPTHVIGTDAFQETPTVEVCRAICKHAYLVQNARDIARIMKEAFYLATTGRPGPVLIDMPKDIQNTIVANPDYDVEMDLPGYVLPPEPTPAKIREVLAAIKESQRPIIYCGGGVLASNAGDELREFASKAGIPVAMTVHGLGSMPSDHYLSLDMLGMHGTVYANLAVSQADLLLAFGVRFDDRVTGKLSEFAKHGKIVHVDIDASEINKNKLAHIPVHSDVKSFLKAINPQVVSGDYGAWRHQIDEWRASDPMTYDQRDDVILPQYVLDEFSKLTKGEFIMSTGVGQHQMWAAQWTKFNRLRSWITSGGLGSMGYGLPAAMGAQAAFPDALVVDIDGDGSFLMNIQELATVFCEDLPVKVIVLNNQHLGMVVQWEDRFHQGNRAHTYLGPIHHPEAIGQGAGEQPEELYPDFIQIAKGFGVKARQIRRKEEVGEALLEMINHKGPYVLDVLVPYQEHVLPMIPSGGTVRDVIKT